MRPQEVLELLHNNECVEVKFEKASDGSERTMFCTLQPEFLPPTTGTSQNPNKNGLMTVWDLEKRAWRSFYTDSIKEVKL